MANKRHKYREIFEIPTMNYYEIFRITTIIIIIICALLIIFKKEVKQYFNEGFENVTTTTTGTTTRSAQTTSAQTTSAQTTTTQPGTTTTQAGTTTTQAGTTTTQASILESIMEKPDFTNLKYNFKVGGYIPLLDLIMTRLLLWRIWNSDLSDMQTTAIQNSPQQGATTNNFYPKQYEKFEDFFAGEIKNIPRLNIFIPKNNRKEEYETMNILLSKFGKPDWMIQLMKYFVTPTIDGKTAFDYINELKTRSPEDREGNTSNTFNDNDLANLSVMTIPIVMREKLEKACSTGIIINLTDSKTDVKQKFNDTTLQLLRFFSDKYPILSNLYIYAEDENTKKLLGIGKDNLYNSENLMVPSIVIERRITGSATFASILGYPAKNGITYMLNLITKPEDIDALLGQHTQNIQETAKRAFLQNMRIGEFIPDEAIEQKTTSITDNIYSYYFNITKMENNMRVPSNQDNNRVFDKINKYKLPVYFGLPNLFELEASKKNQLENTKDNTKILQLKSEINYIQTTLKKYEQTMPYIIYLPIYDFQYIKIVPKRDKSETYMPNMNANIRF